MTLIIDTVSWAPWHAKSPTQACALVRLFPTLTPWGRAPGLCFVNWSCHSETLVALSRATQHWDSGFRLHDSEALWVMLYCCLNMQWACVSGLVACNQCGAWGMLEQTQKAERAEFEFRPHWLRDLRKIPSVWAYSSSFRGVGVGRGMRRLLNYLSHLSWFQEPFIGF